MNQWKPSQYQEKIFEWIKNGKGDAIVEAVAGSGKTTTLVEASKFLQTKNNLFCAFNKHIADELKSKINGMSCKTIHSLGLSCLTFAYKRKLEIKKHKYQEIIQIYYKDIAELIQKDLIKTNKNIDRKLINLQINEAISNLDELIRFTRLTLTNIQKSRELNKLIEFYHLNSKYLPLLIPYIPLILDEGLRLAESKREIDFDDMVWLPYQWQLTPKKKDWLFVDEAQDLNIAQLNLVLKARNKGGRILFVGDSRQAIYGFSGADTDSMKRIQTKTNAIELPLSICYRCPISHIKEAQKIVSHIEPYHNAIKGKIYKIKREYLAEFVKPQDLIICRLNAPLIETCINLISQKIPAIVQGKNIEKRLINIINNLATIDGFNYQNFQDFLNIYRREKIDNLRNKSNSQSRMIMINDECRGVAICYLKFKCNSVEQLCSEIKNIFKQNKHSVTLSTIHKAKGKEKNRIFILLYELLPFTWEKQRDWEKEQELNLKYVALTRAKQELYMVIEPPEEDFFLY